MKKLRKRSKAWKLLWIILTIVIWSILAYIFTYIGIAIQFIAVIVTRNREILNSSAARNFIGILVLIFSLIVVVLSIHLWGKFNTRCDTCKRMGALEWVTTKAIREDIISVPVETAHKNNRGDIIGTQDQYVPGKRIQYRDTYKCKYCGATEDYLRTVDRANI